MKKNYEEMAGKIFEQVGGKANISFATHCMTRLRLNLKDESLVNDENVTKIPGVLGSQFSGGQYQIIIGPEVSKLYNAVCSSGVSTKQIMIQEKPDEEKKPFSLKSISNGILGAVADCLTPMIPILMTAGMIKMIVAVFGDILGLLPAGSDLYRLLVFAGDAGFYFFPVFVAYSGSKRFGCSPVIALLISGIMLHPTLIEIVSSGELFNVYGIPMRLTNYSGTVIPMILCTWVMSHLEKVLKKIVPNILAMVFIPLLEVLIMLPLALCILGPLGGYIGDGLAIVLQSLYNIAGPLGIAVIGALYLPMVAAGMHTVIFPVFLTSLFTQGYDAVLIPASAVGIYVAMAVDLAMLIRAKNTEDRSLASTCLAAQALGGVTEPTIFGIFFRYKKTFAWAIIGNFCGALVVGILGAKAYLLAASNALVALGYGPDIIRGLIGCAVGCAVSFVLTLLLGYENKEKS